MSEEKPLEVEYWSDVLCIWAWVGQPRVEELQKEFEGRINIKYQFVNVFGDSCGKLSKSWADRDGIPGYRRHVEEVVAGFDLTIHPDTWVGVVPRSSLNAHMVAKAVQTSSGEDALANALLAIRRAFFEEARDVSDFDSLTEIVSSAGIDADMVRKEIATGDAAAALMADYERAETLRLRGSPTFVMDGGRQTLFGNVGYRILAANVEELLSTSTGASWC